MEPQELLFDILPDLERIGKTQKERRSSIDFSLKDDQPGYAAQFVTEMDNLSQQSILESLIKKGYQDKIMVYGEENDSEIDGLMKLFNPSSPVLLTIDPIDGTVSYCTGGDDYSIILGVYVSGILGGALVHHPHHEVTYLAWDSSDKAKIIRDNKTSDLVIVPQQEDLLMTAYLPKVNAGRLRERFSLLELDDKGRSDPAYCLSSLLNGKLGGLVRHKASALDYVPIAYIASKGGASVSRFDRTQEDIWHCFGRYDGIEDGKTHSLIASLNKENMDILPGMLEDINVQELPWRYDRA